MILAEKSQEKREMILAEKSQEKRENEIEIGLQSIHILYDPYTTLL